MMATLAVGIIFSIILYQRRVINHQIQMREFNRQKEIELMQASINGEEEERMRIATELHDDVGATLSSIRLFLTQAARTMPNAALIAQSKDLLDESIQKVRAISHQLQPGTLQYLGLPSALQSLAELLDRSGSIRVSFTHDEAWTPPDARTALALYRIVQELLNNIVKHAGATTISIRTQQNTGNRGSVLVANNGSGLSEESYRELLYKKGALGLKNIEMRLKSSRLSIHFSQSDSGIFTTEILLPEGSAEQAV